MDQQLPSDRKADIIVIGAGPAGAAAAIEAARGGLEVLVVDKADFPRPKCCGDGLTANALRHLDQLGFDPGAVPSWQPIEDVVITSPSGRRRVFPLPRNQGLYAAVARRSEFDAELVQRAREAGATVVERCELVDLDQDPGSIEATVRYNGPSQDFAVDGTTTLRARFVIGADGMWSQVRKLSGTAPPDYRGDWHAFRQYFHGVSSRAQRQLMVWFEPDLLPGYAWSFPLADGSANVGFGIIRRTGGSQIQAMKRQWPDLLSRPHIRQALGPEAVAEQHHRAWPIPARLGQMPLALGRIIFVGDAAAATDPMSGEGIGQALETARLAVRCILEEGIDHPTAVRDRYEKALRLGMERDHRLARGLSQVLRSRARTEAALAAMGLTGWTRRSFARWLFEDYPRAAVVNPRCWRRETFTGGGAFRTEVGIDR